MNTLIYWLGRALVACVGALPLVWVARLGRGVGALAYLVDVRHRRVAIQNLTMCFGQEKSPEEIRAIARENFQRIAESYACAIKTCLMSWEKLQPCIEVRGMEHLSKPGGQPDAPSRVIALGHFGNFELFAHFGRVLPPYQLAATYRGLQQPGLNRLMVELRNRSGCLYFERRSGGNSLLSQWNRNGWILGLFADQHAGARGLRGPFLGHDCSTSTAPAVFALRYQCQLHAGVCFRTAPGRWRVEMSPEIPTINDGIRRSVEDITKDVNAVFESAVRRDPANWFWVHKRWKPRET